MGYVKKNHSPDSLWFGIGVHLALANWYQGGKIRGPHPAQTFAEWAGDEFREIRVRETWDDEPRYVDACELGVAMLEHYVEHYGRDDHWDVLAVERPFNVIVRDHGRAIARVMSRWDGVARDERDGELYLLEHKTASSIATAYLELDDQAGLYWAVASQVLRREGVLGRREHISGIVYNFLRKQFPDERDQDEEGRYLNKDGSVSKKQPAPYFVREVIERQPKEQLAQLERLTDEVTVMNAVRSGKIPLWKNTTKDCTFCPMVGPCKLHERGGNAYQDLLAAQYDQEDPYANYRKSAAG